jgi:flagellar assembly factor FliW
VPTVDTLFQGLRDIPAADIITFTAPLLGFDQQREFAVFQTAAGPLHWLQSTTDKRTCFCVLDPFAAGFDPDLAVSAEDIAEVGARDATGVQVLLIVVLDAEPAKMTANLRAPILRCAATGKAKQVVLDDPRLPMACPIAQLPRAVAAGAH